MKITAKQIAEGWTKNEDGVWVAPESPKGKETVLLVESKDVTETLGPGWTRTEAPDRGAQCAAFMRLGLSREAAEVAAGLKVVPTQRDVAGKECRELIKNFDQRRNTCD